MGQLILTAGQAQENLWNTLRDIEIFLGRDIDSIDEWVSHLASGGLGCGPLELADSFMGSFQLPETEEEKGYECECDPSVDHMCESCGGKK